MNKILFLKGLISVLTLLIFLALGGIVYALVNYKTTPKLIPRAKKPAAVQTAPAVPIAAVAQTAVTADSDLSLNQGKDAVLKSVGACGENLICVSVSDPFAGDRIAVVNAAEKTVLYWISIRGQSRP